MPARLVGLEGSTLKGMAFTLFGGQATWDRAGKHAPSPISIKKVSQGVAVSWSSVAGQSYRLMCKSNLIGTNWIDLTGPITATNSVTTFLDATTAADPQRFYQIAQ